MASRKDQVVPATNVKNKNIIASSGGTLGVTIRNKAKELSAILSTPTPNLPKEQEHPRHEPVITLAFIRAPREESPRRYSESLTSDADLSSSSYPVAIQVMTTGATSIKEQLAQINEAIVRLTRTVEEKDLQIVTLINQLEVQHDEKANRNLKEIDEDEDSLMEKVKEKAD